MIKIKTLVYFDLEATGLKSSGRPRISEFSFVAVSSDNVEELSVDIQNHLRKKNNQEYVYVFHQTRFDENTGYLLKNFVDRLPTLVC